MTHSLGRLTEIEIDRIKDINDIKDFKVSKIL